MCFRGGPCKHSFYTFLDDNQERKMELMTMAAVCCTLQVSRRTVYRMIRDGVLPAPKKIGGFRQSYFLRAEFEKACRKQMR